MTTAHTDTQSSTTAILDREVAIVPSYLSGQWVTPDNPTRIAEVADASTGEIVARVSTDGLDIGAAVAYARDVGQKNLRALTLHERALKLKEIALYLGEHKQELYEIAYKSGATNRDNGVDIDGGISTLFTYSSKGRRELPNSDVIIDGPTEVLSKDSSFQGTHIYTPLPGVAVQINAFNFPVWGMLEKFAPSFIAGVPSVVKPATPTGYITQACVRLMVESGILPEGSIQLISGSARDLLDQAKADGYDGHLTYVTLTEPTAQSAALAAQAMLEQVGFTVTVDSVPSVAALVQKIYLDNDFDIARGGLNLIDAAPYMRLYDGLGSESEDNASGYDDPQTDALLEELLVAEGDEDKQQIIDRIQERVTETVPYLVWAPAQVRLVWSEKVHGMDRSLDGIVLLDQAWVQR